MFPQIIQIAAVQNHTCASEQSGQSLKLKILITFWRNYNLYFCFLLKHWRKDVLITWKPVNLKTTFALRFYTLSIYLTKSIYIKIKLHYIGYYIKIGFVLHYRFISLKYLLKRNTLIVYTKNKPGVKQQLSSFLLNIMNSYVIIVIFISINCVNIYLSVFA